jgi:hypothetical protein
MNLENSGKGKGEEAGETQKHVKVRVKEASQ